MWQVGSTIATPAWASIVGNIGGTPASIEIVVDNAVAGWPAFVFALNLFRDLVVARAVP